MIKFIIIDLDMKNYYWKNGNWTRDVYKAMQFEKRKHAWVFIKQLNKRGVFTVIPTYINI